MARLLPTPRPWWDAAVSLLQLAGRRGRARSEGRSRPQPLLYCIVSRPLACSHCLDQTQPEVWMRLWGELRVSEGVKGWCGCECGWCSLPFVLHGSFPNDVGTMADHDHRFSSVVPSVAFLSSPPRLPLEIASERFGREGEGEGKKRKSSKKKTPRGRRENEFPR